MSRHTTRVGAHRASLYTEITDKVIAELEAGRIPWVQPWGTAAIKAPLATPRNAATQRVTAKIVRSWFATLGSKTLYIASGSPRENGYCESFNGKL
jgi:antirestriction protein ArdC